MAKRIVLCADDYGQAPHISDAILALVKAQRLSAVSCLVNMSLDDSYSHKLRAFHGPISIGLHINLTEGKPLSLEYQSYYGHRFFSLAHLLFLAFSYQLRPSFFAAEIRAQIEQFTSYYGFLPDFIDGHQHVHQFPVIRDALMQVYHDLAFAKRMPIRLVQPKISARPSLINVKKTTILLSGVFFKQKLKRAAIPYNPSFSGIYCFDQLHYRAVFLSSLNELEEGGLIMCHPGMLGPHIHIDKIASARAREYAYLNSEDFLLDCQDNKISLKPFC